MIDIQEILKAIRPYVLGWMNGFSVQGSLGGVHYVAAPTGIAATDTANIQAAVDAASAGEGVRLQTGTYALNAQIVINKELYFGGCWGSKLQVSSGAGAIKIIDADHVTLNNFQIDLNNVSGAIGIYLLGGWYFHASDIFIDKATSPADGYGIVVESTDSGDGSHGSFVEQFENIVCNRVKLIGTATKQVTTCTFINLDCEHVLLDNVLAATFLQPVIQSSGAGNKLWDIDDTSGLTILGGDFEGSGTVYTFSGSCNAIYCFGNEIASSFSGTYKSGTVSDTGYFLDFHPDSHFIERLTSDMPFSFHTNLLLSGITAPQFQVQNGGYTNKGRFGINYDGDIVHYNNNLNLISGTQGDLDDTSKWGFALTMGQTWAKMQYADAGTNPRTLTTMMYWEYDGFTFYGGSKISGHYTYTATLDFGSIGAGATAELTVTAGAAAAGDSVYVMPNGAPESGLIWSGYAGSGTVVVRLGNVTGGAIDPASRTWRVDVWKH